MSEKLDHPAWGSWPHSPSWLGLRIPQSFSTWQGRWAPVGSGQGKSHPAVPALPTFPATSASFHMEWGLGSGTELYLLIALRCC